VRETSRTSLFRPSTLLPAAKKSIDAVRRDFKDIILPGGLHDRVRSLAAAAANTKLHGAPYRHMLFYGARHRRGQGHWVSCWVCCRVLSSVDQPLAAAHTVVMACVAMQSQQ
jgi:hypothetical protein